MKNYIYECENIDPLQTTVKSNCNSILFVNQGLTTMYVNGFPLQSGGTLELSGQADEIDNTNYQISWGTSAGPLFVWRKRYS